MVEENYNRIMELISEAALRSGRDPDEITLVAAAKKQSAESVNRAIAAGLGAVGHNYVQEASREIPLYDKPADLRFHMIGPLQKNKMGKAVELFDMVETVEDEAAAEFLSRKALEIAKVMPVLIQVNVSGEPQKSGVSEQDLSALVKRVRFLPSLRLKGLMTMPPYFDEPEKARPFFARLRRLRDELVDAGVPSTEMRHLSMGMSGDFEAAIEEGATFVRIGTSLFGSR